MVDYTFDDDGRLASVTTGGATTTYGYEVAGNLTQTTLRAANGYVESRTYDRAGRLTEVQNAKGGNILSRFTYTLDEVGNPSGTKTRASRRAPVLVDESTEDRPPRDPVSTLSWELLPVSLIRRSAQSNGSMWSMDVVMLDVLAQDPLLVSTPQHQRPVQALGAHRTHPPFRAGVRVGCPDRGGDDPGSVDLEYRVERPGELGVAVANQEPGSDALPNELAAHVPGLLRHPGAVRVLRTAGS